MEPNPLDKYLDLATKKLTIYDTFEKLVGVAQAANTDYWSYKIDNIINLAQYYRADAVLEEAKQKYSLANLKSKL